jgi:ABC-type Zn2+ transport system substrate-binding protein/surface adhesin
VFAHISCLEYRRIQEIYSAYDLGRSFDIKLNGNLSMVQALRDMEADYCKRQGCELQGKNAFLFPSPSEVQDVNRQVSMDVSAFLAIMLLSQRKKIHHQKKHHHHHHHQKKHHHDKKKKKKKKKHHRHQK